MSTMPFNTATPNKAMNPTPAEILKGIPRSQSANTPPMADKGIAVKMSRDCLMLPKVKYSSTKMSAKAPGTATARRLLASTRFSNCPP